MSCHSSPSGSAFTSYAYLATGRALTDSAVNSTFHELQRRYNATDEEARRTYSTEDYHALLDRQAARVRTLTGISDARRASILRRLDAARTADVPNQATLYALHNLTPTVRTRGQNTTRFLTDIAARTGTSVEALRTEFAVLAEVTRSRTGGLPETYTPQNQALAGQYGMGGNVGTVNAVAVLTQRARQAEIAAAAAAPQRIVRQPVTGDLAAPWGPRVTEMGYDQRNGRLEVGLIDPETGVSSVHAYRGVPAYVWAAMTDSGRPSAVWSTRVRGRSEHAYSDEHAAALDGAAPRCATCGQFAAVGHACPPRTEATVLTRYRTRSNWSRQRVSQTFLDQNGNEQSAQIDVHLPAIREFREAFATGPVTVSVQSYVHGGWLRMPEGNLENMRQWARVSGSLTLSRVEDGTVHADTSALECSCWLYRRTHDCPHLNVVADAARLRLDPPARSARSARTPEERERLLAEANARAEAAAAQDWTRNRRTLAEARSTWQQPAEVVYSEDFAAFKADYDAAVAARAEAGAPVVPYQREDALGGYARRGSGQAFGMEIEFEFPSSMSSTERHTAKSRIGRALYDAGLTTHVSQQGYGASKRRGFVDTHVDADGRGTWSFEQDGSVNGGELVTPAMYDEPETWSRLETAVRILREHGAVASKRAGAHVHVGTGFYGGDPSAYTELARLVTQHEDVFYRLASDTGRGTHRGGFYSAANGPVPESGFADVSGAHRWQSGRTRGLNLYNARGEAGDHPEFRLFDASLDPGTMQAQIKLAVASTHAAWRNAQAGGTRRAKEPLGSHAERAAARGARRRVTDEQLAEDTATARSLLDTLFTRRADKAQLVAVLANTKWSKAPR